MLKLTEETLNGITTQGFPLARLVLHLQWVLEDRPGVNDFVQFKARANGILRRHQNPVICIYETAKYGGGIVMDILRTHPMVFVGGLLYENPFFVPPEDFAKELHARRARAAGV